MSTEPNPETMRALGEVKGQLNGIAELLRESAKATNRRLDDLKESVDGRFKDHAERIHRLENNERDTAIKTGAIGVVTGLTGALVGNFLSSLFKIKGGG